MTCPRCATALEPTTLRELGLIYNAHACPACHGLWVGPRQLWDIEMTIDQRWIEIRHLPSDAEQQVPLGCPACAGHPTMQKIVNDRDANVVMDVCRTCKHVWLDPGEREAIEQESVLVLIKDVLQPTAAAD